jgi:disulfide bond formation protein DsbB
MSWLIATMATMGSLFFSNVLNLPPCSLCWWQRIFMYPLVIIFALGYIKKDSDCCSYSTPLVIGGLGFAIYHNLLYYGVIPKSITACTLGVSCTSKQIEWLGFITIPLLSLFAFSILSILTIFHYSSFLKKENIYE